MDVILQKVMGITIIIFMVGNLLELGLSRVEDQPSPAARVLS